MMAVHVCVYHNIHNGPVTFQSPVTSCEGSSKGLAHSTKRCLGPDVASHTHLCCGYLRIHFECHTWAPSYKRQHVAHSTLPLSLALAVLAWVLSSSSRHHQHQQLTEFVGRLKAISPFLVQVVFLHDGYPKHSYWPSLVILCANGSDTSVVLCRENCSRDIPK